MFFLFSKSSESVWRGIPLGKLEEGLFPSKVITSSSSLSSSFKKGDRVNCKCVCEYVYIYVCVSIYIYIYIVNTIWFVESNDIIKVVGKVKYCANSIFISDNNVVIDEYIYIYVCVYVEAAVSLFLLQEKRKRIKKNKNNEKRLKKKLMI